MRMRVCGGGAHYDEDAYCTDAGRGGIVCGPTTAGAMETFTAETLPVGLVLKGPREGNSSYCLHEPEHYPMCVYAADAGQQTPDFAPFTLTQAADDPNAYGIRIGSSGFCTSQTPLDIIHCDTSWLDKWERFNITCA